MKLLISTFFTLLLIGFAGSSYAQFGLFGPSDYDECIIEGMQGVQSDRAANFVAASCMEKFPKEIKKSRNAGQKLTSDELAKVRLVEGNWTGTYISEAIYNGNDFGIKEALIVVAVETEPADIKTYEFIFAPGYDGCVEAKSSETILETAFNRPKGSTWNHSLKSAVKC
jgi:hypothetical protein